MTWQKIHNLSEYKSTVTETSKNSKDSPLCSSETEVFNLEQYGNTLRKLNCAKVDALKVKCNDDGDPVAVDFIEFKGGVDPEKWNDHREDQLIKKVFDSIHCVLHTLLEDHDTWAKMFHSKCTLNYYLVLSDDNFAFKTTEINPIDQLHKRSEHLAYTEEYNKLNRRMSPYRDKRPFTEIQITKASDFEKTYM